MRIPSSHHRSDHDHSSVAMTPMIDIVFLLLIFFVCAAAGAVHESVLSTDLAAAGAVASTDTPPEREPWKFEIWLKLNRDDTQGLTIDMNGTVYSDLDQLERQLQLLAEVEATNPVILDVGDGVRWGEVIDLYDRCRRAGLQSVNFAADASAIDQAAPVETP